MTTQTPDVDLSLPLTEKWVMTFIEAIGQTHVDRTGEGFKVSFLCRPYQPFTLRSVAVGKHHVDFPPGTVTRQQFVDALTEAGMIQK